MSSAATIWSNLLRQTPAPWKTAYSYTKLPNQCLHKTRSSQVNLLSVVRLKSSQTESAPAAKVKSEVGESGKSSTNKKLSSAMKQYTERKRAHDIFIAKERSEFELGKKHLANMMGMDYDAMSQEDVDKAIDYLFPSGLFHQDARPKMKPPEEIFPKQKDAEFDEDGRPFHPFFYSLYPNFVQTMYDVVDQLENSTFFADRMMKQNKSPDPTLIISDGTLSTTRWMNKEELQKLFFEQINDGQVQELVTVLGRLVENPYSYKYRDTIFKFRTPIATIKAIEDQQEHQFDKNGRAYVEYTGLCKSSVAKVRVTKPGSGIVKIRHIDYPEHECDIRYFFSLKDRNQLLYPLQFTKLLGLVDIDCIVDSGGSSGQAGAIRYALSKGLRCFVDEESATEMKVAGLLTQEVRVHERKKPGQKGARAKYTWLKR